MPSYKVELALYDLSMGMAASLSGQLLGPDHAIPMIPHTGILAYGREYFFSSGIQNLDPTVFRGSRGIQPVQIISIGNTTVSRQEFENWCNSSSARSLYNETSYDLFHRNCNNFSDFALKNGLGFDSGVPEWILDVPRKVSNSPMGQMIMPMMNSMQAPFSQNGNAQAFSPAPAPTTSPNPSTKKSSIPEHNPWANISSEGKNTSTEILSKSNHSPPMKKVKNNDKMRNTPFLDSQSNLLLSNDTKTIPMCVKKLKSLNNLNNTQESCDLDALQKDLSDASPRMNPLNVEKALWKYVEYQPTRSENTDSKSDSVSVVMALMLLRLVVLYPIVSNAQNGSTSTDKIMPKFLHSLAFQLSLDTKEKEEKKSSTSVVSGVSARCMAWCTLSNAFSHPSNFTDSMHLSNLEKSDPSQSSTHNNASIVETIDNAIHELSSARKELRQAASAFLNNLVHIVTTTRKNSKSIPKSKNNSDETLPEWVVAILCSCFDGLGEETDDVTQFRRLLVVVKLIQHFGSPASSLVTELGFVDLLRDFQHDSTGNKDFAVLAKESLEFLFVD